MEEFMEWSRIKWPDNKEISLRRPENSEEKPFTITIRSINDRLRRVEKDIEEAQHLLAQADSRDPMEEPPPDDITRFGRVLANSEIVPVSAMSAYRCAAEVDAYPEWMPYCKSTEIPTLGEFDALPDATGRLRYVHFSNQFNYIVSSTNLKHDLMFEQ